MKPGQVVPAGAVGDHRPLALGAMLGAGRRRATASHMARLHVGDFADLVYPTNCAVGEPSGTHQYVTGVRMMAEEYPNFVFVKIDKANAYNNIDRGKYSPPPCVFPPCLPCKHAVFRRRPNAGLLFYT